MSHEMITFLFFFYLHVLVEGSCPLNILSPEPQKRIKDVVIF